MSNGKTKTTTIKKRCKHKNRTFKETSLPASITGSKTVKPAQTKATTIIFR